MRFKTRVTALVAAQLFEVHRCERVQSGERSETALEQTWQTLSFFLIFLDKRKVRLAIAFKAPSTNKPTEVGMIVERIQKTTTFNEAKPNT